MRLFRIVLVLSFLIGCGPSRSTVENNNANVPAPAQTSVPASQPASIDPQAIISFGREGEGGVSFVGRYAVDLFTKVSGMLQPSLRQNAYFPPYLRERLAWVETHADFTVTPQILKQMDGLRPVPTLIVHAAYCGVKGEEKPCVTINALALVLQLRFGSEELEPNEEFKNTCAVLIAHEGVHFELPRETFTTPMARTREQDVKEEVRAWTRTLKDMVHPLRQGRYQVCKDLERFDDSLSECGYKLPCPKFEREIDRTIE